MATRVALKGSFRGPLAKWKLRVDCSFGGTYNTIWHYPPEKEWYRIDHDVSCNFGVNNVYIVEGT